MKHLPNATTEIARFCPVQWDPEVWPYITRCRLKPNHKGHHRDHRKRILTRDEAKTRTVK